VETEAKREFQARRRGVPLFAEGHLDDPIVIDPKGFAHRILGDLEPAVNVPAQFRFEIELQVKRQGGSILRLTGRVRGFSFRQRAENFLSDQCLEPATG